MKNRTLVQEKYSIPAHWGARENSLSLYLDGRYVIFRDDEVAELIEFLNNNYEVVTPVAKTVRLK